MMDSLDDWIPSADDLLSWWENFWHQRQQPFGPPSKNLMPFILDEVSSRSPEVLKAIDIASGNGRYAIPLAKMGCEATALEWTESGVRKIQEQAKANRVSVIIDRSDFTKACFKERGYDLVVCSGLLEEIAPIHHTDALRGLAKWTSPGGLAVVKYCLELEGRGELVKAGLAENILKGSGMSIIFSNEQSDMKISSATKMGSRTGTVIARQPK